MGNAATEFDARAKRLARDISLRFLAPLYGLNGARGMHLASDQVTRDDFKAYVGSHDMSRYFPGVRGLGFIRRVERADLPQFLSSTKADGAPNFSFRQLKETDYDDHYVVQYFEPEANNQHVLGMDVGSELVRRTGVMQAIETGEPIFTGALALEQGKEHASGMLLYVPVFDPNKSTSSPKKRKEALMGLYYTPVAMEELLATMPEIKNESIKLKIFDSPANTPYGTPMFDTEAVPARSVDASPPSLFSSELGLRLPGRELTLIIQSPPAFDQAVDRASYWLVLAGGSALSVLLALLARQLLIGRAQAQRLAENLTQELNRLAQVAQHTSNAVNIADREGRIQWINEGFTRITGYTAEEAIGRSPGELLGSGKAPASTLTVLKSAIDEGQECRVTILNRAKDGREYWVDTELKPIINDSGQVTAFMEISSDITTLRETMHKMESAQRETESLLATINLHAIVSTAGRNGRITSVNDAFCDISGYTREELLGQDHRIVNSGMHGHTFWVDMWKTIRSGMPWRGEVCNRSKTGSLYWVDTFISPFVGDDGRIDKYISIRIDITESKSASMEIMLANAATQRAMEELNESQERNTFALEGSGAGVWDWNLATNTVQYSLLWKTMLGYEAHEIGNDVSEWSSRVHPDDLPSVMADVQANLDGKTHSFSNEHRFRCKDGTYLWILDRGMVVKRDARGAPLRMVGTHADITQRKADALALQAATEAAHAASEAKSQFLANMSHEIRTPMNAILGMLTLLRKTELTTKQADYAAKSEGAARSLLGLINDILDFSKIEAGKMALDPQPFALDELLQQLSTILATSAGEKHVEVLFDVDPSVPCRLVGDAMRLQQVLLNLGSNAIKFTPEGEVVLSIELLQQHEDAVTLRFAMRDSGIGIAPENQARIFSGFTQAEASTTRRFGGTGLGLAISQRFVSMMGGELELHSVLGEGSRFHFTITLPVAPATPALSTDSAPNPGNFQVLVVDDNPLAREVLERMCTSQGWNVQSASSGEEAIAYWQASHDKGTPFQAILVDWMMPGMDGWQTSERIRALQHTEDPAPVVMMVTSHGREMLAQRSPEDQALLDGYLVKPVTATMLLDAVMLARKHPGLHSTATVPSTQTEGPRLGGMRLLVVEDNINNQQVAKELLEGEGATVQLAGNGRIGVETIADSKQAFDVVLMDLQMPEMDGFEATRHIRSVMGLHALPIVAMTANAMASDREACLAAGMNDHVSKPFDLTHLVQVLRKQAGWSQSVAAPTPDNTVLDPAIQEVAASGGIDVAPAMLRLGNKVDVYTRMLANFIGELESLPAELRRLSALMDIGTVRRHLHTIKGLAATLGATALATASAQHERAVGGDTSAEQLAATVEQSITAITDTLPKIHALRAALQLSQQAAAKNQPRQAPLNREAAHQALQKLAELLRNNDMEAMTHMSKLVDDYGETLGERMPELEHTVANLDFDNALPACLALLEGLTE